MLENLTKYYKNLGHQNNAIIWLESELKNNGYGDVKLLSLNQDSATLLENKLSKETIIEFQKRWRDVKAPSFRVPYYSQLDNKIMPFVTCNSSSNAMFLSTYKPDAIKNDDEYVARVMSGEFGYKGHKNPSIYHDVHTRALASYGLKTTWLTGVAPKTLREIVSSQPATVVNVLHKGSISQPRGGHIVVITALTDGVDLLQTEQFEVYDPYGELNYLSGGYNSKASGIYKVSVSRFLKRYQGGARVLDF